MFKPVTWASIEVAELTPQRYPTCCNSAARGGAAAPGKACWLVTPWGSALYRAPGGGAATPGHKKLGHLPKSLRKCMGHPTKNLRTFMGHLPGLVTGGFRGPILPHKASGDLAAPPTLAPSSPKLGARRARRRPRVAEFAPGSLRQPARASDP